jgi:hypothetical protein
MLHLLEGSAANLVRIKIGGTLTDADHQAFLKRIHEVIEKYGSVRILCEADNLEGWDNLSAWDDATLSLRERERVGRVTIVADASARKWMERMVEPFVNARFFTPEQSEEAWNWAVEGAQEEIDREWIRRTAYYHWEAAGRPNCDGTQFWFEAEHDLLHSR